MAVSGTVELLPYSFRSRQKRDATQTPKSPTKTAIVLPPPPTVSNPCEAMSAAGGGHCGAAGFVACLLALSFPAAVKPLGAGGKAETTILTEEEGPGVEKVFTTSLSNQNFCSGGYPPHVYSSVQSLFREAKMWCEEESQSLLFCFSWWGLSTLCNRRGQESHREGEGQRRGVCLLFLFRNPRGCLLGGKEIVKYPLICIITESPPKLSHLMLWSLCFLSLCCCCSAFVSTPACRFRSRLSSLCW